MFSKTRIAMTVGLAALALANPALGQDCAALGDLPLENGRVTAAALVEAGAFTPPGTPSGPAAGGGGGPYADLPAFCRVQATLTPTPDSGIKVEVWLPAAGWNGKYVGIGNGVWAGQLSLPQLAGPLSRGFAAATTDTGHTGNGLSAEWAVGHPEKLVDFGHRAVHLMTVTAKQAIAAYYGRPAALSFWDSCSTGGRQGLMSAYRYPQDYDAISAMAPANPMTDLMTQSMWANWVNKRSAGAQLDPGKLALVHQAVLNQCDALDGLEDGVIARPEACGFEPASLVCPAGGGDCLSAAQAEAMQAIYDGVQASDGNPLLPGWPRGAEMQLAALVTGPEPFPVAMSYFQQLVHAGDAGWDWKEMDYAGELRASRAFGAAILDVPATGLRAFFARGGRLLLSHGWNDGLIPAGNTLAFHRELSTALDAETREGQLRLFMAPGMNHCAGGEGPNSFDTLGTLDAWAASGQAPDRIVATRLSAPGPNAPRLPPMSRPLCPYPQIARHDGEGDTSDAANFSCVAPRD